MPNKLEEAVTRLDEPKQMTTKYELESHMYQHKNIAIIGNSPRILQRET